MLTDTVLKHEMINKLTVNDVQLPTSSVSWPIKAMIQASVDVCDTRRTSKLGEVASGEQ